ncbi:MAG: hypothetical protein IM575_13005 [Cytophagales bacterium]|nr:hypothetical protein [Cytophagales bacterium]
MKGFVFIFCMFFLLADLHGQEKKDSTRQQSAVRKAIGRGIALISTAPNDTIKNEWSSSNFEGYANKIVRKIEIDFIGLDRSVYDTTKRVNRTVSRIANSLHTQTKENVIRNHLFVYKNKPLNPFLLADNERFLRSLDFILDARMVVTPIEGTDSVDIMVITRDVFSLGGSLGGSPTAPEFSLYDANLAGGGQRFQFSGKLDPGRDPRFGYSLQYQKSSLLGSLANLEMAYTELNNGVSLGSENEYAYYVRLHRPLVSPYSRLAGGLEVSNNWSRNIFNRPDSAFLNYKYQLVDTWAGYNLGIKSELANRNRYFLAVRYFDNFFSQRPAQEVIREQVRYASSSGLLGELTFYRKNYFKTRYVVGFGRTEDIPIGVSVSVAMGYLTLLGKERPYGGVKIDYLRASKRGDFYEIKLESGGFVQEKSEDVLLKAAASFYTRARNAGKSKLRTFVGGGYTALFNKMTSQFLSVGNRQVFGFVGDSILGTHQVFAKTETTLYIPFSLAGFRFAPFIGIDAVQTNCLVGKEQVPVIVGLNGGVRTRNENLIFGTMELRFTFIPDDGRGKNQFGFSFRQNLQVRNATNFIVAPSQVVN